MDSKIQMMDAGSVFFSMEEGFGTAMGQVRAEMKAFGRVGDVDDWMLLDSSDLWMKRYVLCRVEDAGMSDGRHRYCAVFREGSRSTPLRNLCLLACAAGCLVFAFTATPKDWKGVMLTVLFILVAISICYDMMRASRSSVETLERLKGKIEEL